MPQLAWAWRGRIRHERAVAEMEERRSRILAGDEASMQVVLAEHDPVITLGRSADRAHVRVPPAELSRLGVEVVDVSRGGDVTFHGPGQLMIYPIVRLRGGLVRFLETVAAAIVEHGSCVGVRGAAWRRDPAGVWLGDAKLAACGVHVSRGVTIHGFALDVATPEQCWQLIVPCGLSARRTTSLAESLRDRCPSVEEVARVAGPILTERLSALVGTRGMRDDSAAC